MGKNKHVWLLCLVLSVACVTLVSALHTRSQVGVAQGPLQRKQVKQAEGVDTSQFSVVDFAAPKPTDPKERARREAKGKKYNSRYAPLVTESVDDIYATTDWDVGLPARKIRNDEWKI